MTQAVRIDFDDALDVVSARLVGAPVVRARPFPTDLDIILELDASDRVIGFELLGPTRLPPTVWHAHPARSSLPIELAMHFDEWLNLRWASSHR